MLTLSGKYMLEQPIIDDESLLPNITSLVTEDDTPVDSLVSAKQQRLLVSSLYSSYKKQTFLSETNVGVFYLPNKPAIFRES